MIASVQVRAHEHSRDSACNDGGADDGRECVALAGTYFAAMGDDEARVGAGERGAAARHVLVEPRPSTHANVMYHLHSIAQTTSCGAREG